MIASSTGLGYHLYSQQKIKLNICNELYLLCERLLVDLNYNQTPIQELLEKNLFQYKYLLFIDTNNLKQKNLVLSNLSILENEEISTFIYSLGKSDAKTQIRLIEAFKQYTNTLINKYQNELKQKGRMYICFGIFIGIILSIILV